MKESRGWCFVDLLVYSCILKTSVGAKFTMKLTDLSVVFHRCVGVMPFLEMCEESLSFNNCKKKKINNN